jgi:hypothetical protein
VEEYHATKIVVPAYRREGIKEYWNDGIMGYIRKTFYKDKIDSESSSE